MSSARAPRRGRGALPRRPRRAPLARAGALLGVLALLLVLAGCGGEELHPVRGTTTRVGTPSAAATRADKLHLRWLTNADDCDAAARGDETAFRDCLPFVDRATGQVRLSFRVDVDTEPFAVRLSEDEVQVFHKETQIQAVEGTRQRVSLVPHDPVRSPQLFILLIDHSGSMTAVDAPGEPARIDKVRAALLRRDVVDAFFPPAAAGEQPVRTAVLPVMFGGKEPPEPLVGASAGQWVLSGPDDYKHAVQTRLTVVNEYTHLYNAVRWSITELANRPEVKDLIQSGMQPTIVALTDGFNNEAPADTCADNAPRLTELLKTIDKVRRGLPANQVPIVYTVGLGKGIYPSRKRGVEAEPREVSAAGLCHQYPLWTIDGSLERVGLDNEALSRIARVGGGAMYLRTKTDGLAEAFKAAAAVRFRWYEVRYQVDPYHLRRSFTTRVRILSLLGVEGAVPLHPSGWLDGPPGALDADGWAHPAPFSATIALVLPFLGAFVSLGYLPAALHNARRPFRARERR